MNIEINKINNLRKNLSTGVIFDHLEQFSLSFISKNESGYLKNRIKDYTEVVIFKHPEILFFHKQKKGIFISERIENARKAGAKLYSTLKKEKIEAVQLMNFSNQELMIPFIEGILLASYTFSKYLKEKEDTNLKKIFVFDNYTTEKQINELIYITQAVFWGRDLVNEPLSYLTAEKLSEEIENIGIKSGFSVEIFRKQKIKSLKMGGLLAVNKGSIDPPTFTVAEWNPPDAKNINPIILVGKGIVFDTGGLSLKPTQNSMDYMKSDMGGAAVVAATLYAMAKNNVPLKVIGLIPATDNRPDGNAYAPGDIITMHDGTTVEIKNTDAEGRLILADALSYAKKYNPELVIDIATLTGSAAMIGGQHSIIGMGNIPSKMRNLIKSGVQTHERIIELPLWKEFSKPLKSSVADLNNLGSREGQAIIAGKFLEHFTDYPWIHLDIAGVAFFTESNAYISKGGTGFGIRLLFHYLNQIK